MNPLVDNLESETLDIFVLYFIGKVGGGLEEKNIALNHIPVTS